jgi:hypothetical protein
LTGLAVSQLWLRDPEFRVEGAQVEVVQTDREQLATSPIRIGHERVEGVVVSSIPLDLLYPLVRHLNEAFLRDCKKRIPLRVISVASLGPPARCFGRRGHDGSGKQNKVASKTHYELREREEFGINVRSKSEIKRYVLKLLRRSRKCSGVGLNPSRPLCRDIMIPANGLGSVFGSKYCHSTK